ncbi:MAG TPA: ImcF-related family protein [Terracidiphilus sp.]|nr:ImcF-related family protein [Terracidiphilus sp.]
MLPILVSVVILILSIVLAWVVGPLLGLAGTSLLVLRILLVALGALASGIVLFFHIREKHRDAATRNMPGGADLDLLLREAASRLASAQRTGPKSLDSLPLLYILGDGNAAKTTAVIKSGFDPELLAGQVYREQDIVQTPVANFWFAQSSAFVEAGDAVRKALPLWTKLVRKTRPKAMRSAMGKEMPVRAAVVCVSSEIFLGTTAADAALASARSTNQMLRALAQQLGTEVPVYVILTKLDRIPYFTEYVRNLGNDEASQPLGVAFPRQTVSSGLYAEKATTEVVASLDRVFFSLAEFRSSLLTRETDPRNVDPVYEFPRELRKLRNNLASYLVEVARPSHLNANPYLRGFYAVGVRATIVETMVAAAAAQPQSQPAGSGATRMFTVQDMQAAPQAQTPQTVQRKQAQWCFLPRLFPDQILGDRSALAGTSNSRRTHLFRRVVFATVSLLLFFYLLGLTASWIHNGHLENEIVSAANALPPIAAPLTTLASTDQLTQLDKLRAAIAQLENFQQNGIPLFYRFGLYHGNSVLEAARRIYFDRFDSLILAQTQANLVASFNALPQAPAQGADYSATYNPLKAYLITTSNPEKSTVDFLPPVLLQYWENGRVPDTEQQKDLAALQIEFYAGELPKADPLQISPDTLAVNRARTYLAGFGGYQHIYQTMLAAADKVAPSVDFNKNYPGSSATVVDAHVVQGAFTKTGYAFMQDAIAHPDRYFSGDVWVLGNQAPPSLDRAALTQQLNTMYSTDFANEWRNFLHSAQVVRYGSLSDASTKLQMLSNPNSPLLALFFTVSDNTAIANPDIAKEFQPAQALVAPGNPDRFVGQGNQTYMTGLIGLQAAVAQVAQAPPTGNPNDPSVVAPIIQASTQAHTAATQTAQAFNLDPQAHVDQTVLELLQDPINSVDAVVRGRGAAVINGGGAGFCSAFNQLTSKFPFNPNATLEANPSDLATLLQAGSGALWQFYDASLKQLIIQQGTTYVAAPNAPVKVSPDFLRFFNRVAQLSNGLYGPGSQGLPFTVHIIHSAGIQSVSFQVDMQNLSGSDVSRQFTWSPSTSHSAQLTANYGSNSLPLGFSGPWSVFHLLAKGKPVGGGATQRLDYPLEIANTPIQVSGVPLVVHIELSGPNASLMVPGGLSGLHCVSTVAR